VDTTSWRGLNDDEFAKLKPGAGPGNAAPAQGDSLPNLCEAIRARFVAEGLELGLEIPSRNDVPRIADLRDLA